MPYVGSDGTIQQSRPFGLSMVLDLFWGSINFVNLFFRTLFHLDDGPGPRGANGRAPRTPGRGRMGGVNRMGGVAPPPCVGGG